MQIFENIMIVIVLMHTFKMMNDLQCQINTDITQK